jgi:hypothetical protein
MTAAQALRWVRAQITTEHNRDTHKTKRERPTTKARIGIR